MFTGQGSQKLFMGHSVYQNFKNFRLVLQEISDYVNMDIVNLIYPKVDDPKNTQTLTTYAQIAIFAFNLALLRVYQQLFNMEAAVTLGHSLGELCARYFAKSLDLKQMSQLVMARNQFMNQALENYNKLNPQNPLGMCAVLGPQTPMVESLCQKIEHNNCVIANYNNYTQNIISGTQQALQEFKNMTIAQNITAKIINLDVAGAFHSRFMHDAKEELITYLSTLNFNPPTIPVVSNLYANSNPINPHRDLALHVVGSVRWFQSLEFLKINYAEATAIEFGNRVLVGINKNIFSTQCALDIILNA